MREKEMRHEVVFVLWLSFASLSTSLMFVAAHPAFAGFRPWLALIAGGIGVVILGTARRFLYRQKTSEGK
ncbi:hypothetical protein PQU92_05930 [Asticcacaulis sp. BYS171W]|uniref:Uncharacterized protein n=1 Tax=Asticcacaulis aquaticus TaxID=2984212 RepID=A0ABT5HSI6_9CAUL|nr:hypothetical protein [Asticcacaulis aquaticus]MDC7682805.1 hypothetical protein [Asticcacaulis aquaticus]